jgi:serine/threonine protein kinase
VYLHAKGVIHGDIKADNILVSDDLHAQICDFGLAKLFEESTASSLKGAGSLRWKSPEIADGEPKTIESDVYAFGMTIVEVAEVSLC